MGMRLTGLLMMLLSRSEKRDGEAVCSTFSRGIEKYCAAIVVWSQFFFISCLEIFPISLHLFLSAMFFLFLCFLFYVLRLQTQIPFCFGYHSMSLFFLLSFCNITLSCFCKCFICLASSFSQTQEILCLLLLAQNMFIGTKLLVQTVQHQFF